MVKLNKVIHNGAVFWNHYGKRNYDGLMTLENERAVITGWFSLALMTNSYKFRDQLQIHIFAPKGCGQKEYRNESIWNGTEINIDVDEIDDIIEALQQFKFILEEEKEHGKETNKG